MDELRCGCGFSYSGRSVEAFSTLPRINFLKLPLDFFLLPLFSDKVSDLRSE
jgi:hypothetical protein